MNYDERMSQCYEEIIACQAQGILDHMVKLCVREMQKCKRGSGFMTSKEDSGLENLWDEVCVQIQDERSIFWDNYEDYMENLLSELLLRRCSENERKMLWFQTEAFDDWYAEVIVDDERFSQGFNANGMPDAYSIQDITEWCLSGVLAVAADYTNARIERYLSQGCEMD